VKFCHILVFIFQNKISQAYCFEYGLVAHVRIGLVASRTITRGYYRRFLSIQNLEQINF
jgi:hypothetical protein